MPVTPAPAPCLRHTATVNLTSLDMRGSAFDVIDLRGSSIVHLLFFFFFHLFYSVTGSDPQVISRFLDKKKSSQFQCILVNSWFWAGLRVCLAVTSVSVDTFLLQCCTKWKQLLRKVFIFLLKIYHPHLCQNLMCHFHIKWTDHVTSFVTSKCSHLTFAIYVNVNACRKPPLESQKPFGHIFRVVPSFECFH